MDISHSTVSVLSCLTVSCSGLHIVCFRLRRSTCTTSESKAVWLTWGFPFAFYCYVYCIVMCSF